LELRKDELLLVDLLDEVADALLAGQRGGWFDGAGLRGVTRTVCIGERMRSY